MSGIGVVSPAARLPAVVALVLCVACHDAPSAWEPLDEPPAAPGVRQLTYSPGDDRSPAWSASGDSVIYVAEGYGDLAISTGVLLMISPTGGPAETALPLLQADGLLAPVFLSPAVEPSTGRVAYVQIIQGEGGVCSAESVACDAIDFVPPPPSLRNGRIRVRSAGATTGSEQDPTLTLVFDGVEFDDTQHPFGLPGVWITRLHPFQRRYNDEGIHPARASWSPGGERLVTSDGLRLLIWSPGDASASPLPGTDDGGTPAWSPDGDRIAFARLDRGPSLSTTCQYTIPGRAGPIITCVEERTQWPITRSVIALVPPSGGAPTELAEGSDPAWSPDGAWVYFARPDGIWRIRAEGGSPEAVAGAEGGAQPAVSPDGTEVAFVRRNTAGKGDIWIVSVTP